MDIHQLRQAGLRANRKPIPGDWDYMTEEEIKAQEEASKATGAGKSKKKPKKSISEEVLTGAK
jgi:hypothetical protein